MENLVRAVISILEAAKTAAPVGSPIKDVKAFFFGDPVLIPNSQLPAVVVMPDGEEVTARGTAYDQADSRIRVKLVQSVKGLLGQNSADPENVAMAENAIRIFEARNADGSLSAYSVIGALRSDPSLKYQGKSTADWNGAYSMDYGFTDVRGFVAFETSLSMITKKVFSRT